MASHSATLVYTKWDWESLRTYVNCQRVMRIAAAANAIVACYCGTSGLLLLGRAHCNCWLLQWHYQLQQCMIKPATLCTQMYTERLIIW